MSTALKPVRDCGPEFGRRFERRLRAELRSTERDAARQFSSRLFEIGRDCDRFDRAEAIQAECDRLLTVIHPAEPEDSMSLDPPIAVAIRSSSAPHPLNEDVTSRAARIAEGARPAAPSARPSTIVGQLVVDLVAAITLCTFLAAAMLWACVFAGRL